MCSLRCFETESRFAYASLPWFCVQLDFYAYYKEKVCVNATAVNHLPSPRRGGGGGVSLPNGSSLPSKARRRVISNFDCKDKKSMPLYSLVFTGTVLFEPVTCAGISPAVPHQNQPGVNSIKLFHSQEWSIWNFPCTLTRNSTPHSMKNLAFHRLLRWKMIVLVTLTASLIYFSLKLLGDCAFRNWEWKG